MKKENGKLPIMDIHQAAYLDFHQIEPNLSKQGSRVIFDFPNNKQVLELIKSYNKNPSVPILDFVHHLRKLRSQMLAAR